MSGGFLDRITPVVLTYNEEPNIARTLERLRWAREVVLVDSGSTDGTLGIVRAFPNVRVCTRPFDHHADQWNFALRETGIGTEWVMALDADYVLGEDLIAEIAALQPSAETSGYEIAFRYVIEGVPLRASLYPPLVVLFRNARARYARHGHRMVLELEPKSTQRLEHRIDHDDRKSPARWLASQHRYAALEAERLRGLGYGQMRRRDVVRRLVFLAPWLVPLYCVVILGVWRNGRQGWRYVKERAIAEWLIARELLRGPAARGDAG